MNEEWLKIEEYFKKEARKILHRQPSEQVDEFLITFPYNPVLYGYEVFDGVQKKITDKLFYEHAKEALEHIKLINDDRYLASAWKQDFKIMIERLEHVVAFNEKRIFLGRKSKLSETDVIRLIMLKQVFDECFQIKTANFKKGLLRQLGELVVGEHVIPKRNPDKQLDKFT